MIGLSFTSLGDLGRWLSGAIDKDALNCCRGKEIQEKHVNSLLKKKKQVPQFSGEEKKERKCVKNHLHFFLIGMFCVIELYDRD